MKRQTLLSLMILAFAATARVANCQPVHSSQPLRAFTSPEGRAESFGWSIAADGSRLYVGDPDDRTVGLERGSVHGIDLESGAHLFTAKAPGSFGRLGYDVTALNGVVVATALTKSIAFQEDGAAYVFDGTTGASLHRLDNPNPAFGAHFGTSANAVFGKVLIGAIEDSSSGVFSSGKAYLFETSGGSSIHTFSPPAAELRERGTFGFDAVEFGADQILIGAAGNRTVYSFSKSTGELVNKYVATQDMAPVSWAQSLAVAGSNILVGDPLSRLNGDLFGAVYVLDGITGEWKRSLQSPNPRSTNFGFSIDTQGDLALIGAPADIGGGRAYLYRVSTGELLQSFEGPNPTAQFIFGYDVELHRGKAYISAPTGASDRLPGQVFEYAIVPEPPSNILFGSAALLMCAQRWIKRRR